MKRTIALAALCTFGLLVAAVPSVSRSDDGIGSPILLKGCRIKPADQVTLSANQSGVLRMVPREGDRVDGGQQVIMLEDDLARATLAAAELEAANDLEIRYSEVSSDVFRQEHEQLLQVNSRSNGTIIIADVRRAKLEFDRSLMQIEQAKHKQAIAVIKRDEAAAQLNTYYLVSPFAGTVNKVLKYKGEAVRQGEPVLELVNTRRLRVEGFLDAVYHRQVVPGTSVTVEPEVRAGESVPPAVGKIVFVDKVVQPVTRQIRIWADVDNSDELLLPGQTAVMTILPGTAPRETAHR